MQGTVSRRTVSTDTWSRNVRPDDLPMANLPSPEANQRVQNQIAEFLSKYGTARGTTLLMNRSRNPQKWRSQSTSDRSPHPVGDWRSSTYNILSSITPGPCMEGMFRPSTSSGRGEFRFNSYGRGESQFQFPDIGTFHGHESQPRDKPARRFDVANEMNTTPRLLFERIIKAVDEDQVETDGPPLQITTGNHRNYHTMGIHRMYDGKQGFGSMKNELGFKSTNNGHRIGVSVDERININNNFGVLQKPQIPLMDDNFNQNKVDMEEIADIQNTRVTSVTTINKKVTQEGSNDSNSGSTDINTKVQIRGDGVDLANKRFSTDGMTLEKAVRIVASKPPGAQDVEQAALYIQQACFKNQANKYELRTLNGIAKLVEALGLYKQPKIRRAVGGALRNAVFEDDDNKMEVKAVGGLEALSEVLTNSDDTETLRQVTGTLWNLSSLEELKPPLLDLVLQPLSSRVITPHMKNNKDMELLHNSTGCLRNLSSALPLSKRLILEDEDLVNSLVSWSQRNWNHDDHQDPDYSLNTLEHSICTLRNISYESEMSAVYVPEQPRRSPSFFGSTSPKTKFMFDTQPKGAAQLYHPQMLQTYTRILHHSKNPVLREAAAGGLHNITSRSSEASKSLGKMFLRKDEVDGVGILKNLLQGQDPTTTISAVHIIRNLSRCPENHNIISEHFLPSLLSLLSTRRVPGTPDRADVLLTSTCSSISSLIGNNPVAARRLVDLSGIQSLHALASQNSSSLKKSGMAAGMVLQQLWDIKGMRQLLKKRGWSREHFVAPVLQKLISNDEDLNRDHYDQQTLRDTLH
uniref:Uncharacterized protein n=2 Tax=Eptatretus burgeri TaxID=7764 RepID=A0A8C4QWA8_EPTBU